MEIEIHGSVFLTVGFTYKSNAITDDAEVVNVQRVGVVRSHVRLGMQEHGILVVEDERNIALVLAYNIKKEGYDCDVTYDGLQGLERRVRFVTDDALRRLHVGPPVRSSA